MQPDSQRLHVQVRLDLFDHQRFADLLALLDDDQLDPRLAYASVVLLWVEAMKRQQDGDFTDWSPAGIARASHWPGGDRERWFKALLGAGFLHRVDARLLIRNWDEYSGKLFIQREKERERWARRADSAGAPAEHREDSNGVTAEHPGRLQRSSSRAETEDLRPETQDEELHLPTSARDDDDFLRSLDDDPGNVVTLDDRPGQVSLEANSAESPERPFRDRAAPGEPRHKEPPASAEELAELKSFWGRRFAEIGAEPVFRSRWTYFMDEYPDACARKLNDWLAERQAKEKERALPDAPAAPTPLRRSGKIPADELDQFAAFEAAEIRAGRSA